MKNDTTFVRMRSGDHLGDAKVSKKGHLAPSNYRKRGSASYIVREVQSVRERERERETEVRSSETEVTSPLSS